MSNKIKTKQLKSFLNNLIKLKPDEVLGILKILNIPLTNEDGVKAFDLLLADLMEKYEHLNKQQRRTLDAIINTANLPEEKGRG